MPNPIDRINFCTEYNSELQCVTCQENYWLDGPICSVFPEEHLNMCKTLIKNDEKFVCETCNRDHVKVNNGCSLRENIVNCEIHTLNRDDCDLCD